MRRIGVRMMLEKIRQFFGNMTSKQKYGVIGGVVALLIALTALVVILMTGGDHEQPVDSTTTGGDEKTTYTIEVKTEGGRVLSDVSVFFYEDSTLAELVTIGETDENGKLSFTDKTLDTYVAVLKDLPTGYQVADSYALTGENTEIVISTAVIKDSGLDGVSYKVGDVIRDFTVTTPEGVSYTLSDLLKEKKAVVLNFWYTQCDPCKQEFPHLQAAYERYQDKIELLAINPVEADDAAISAFQTNLELAFPMVQGDAKWQNAFNLVYPTTVVVDRYGVITLIHKGTVPDTKTFENLFAYFTADDYVQTLFADMTSFVPEDGSEENTEDGAGTEEDTEESTEAVGSENNPIELGGVTEFDVEVKAGEKVYYNLYRVNDMIFTLEDADAYVICGGETYEPTEGVITFVMKAEDFYTPVSVVFGNSGNEDKVYKVTLGMKEGTFGNPFVLEMGEFTTEIEAGNDQGVYYLYTVTEDGIVTIKNIDATEGVVHGYVLYNLTTYVQRTLGEDGDTEVSIEVHAGDELMVTVAVLPDEENEYPAATIESDIRLMAAGSEDDSTEETPENTTEADQPTQEPSTEVPTQGSTEAEKKTYTVVVKNFSGKKIAGVKMILNGKTYTTNAYGEVNVQLLPGSYTVEVTSVPSEYKKPVTTYQLTSSKVSVTITLSKQSTPTTEEQETQAPTTEAPEPTTQESTTQAPTTQAPTTQAPTTQAPTTEAPTTQAPTTQTPTTEAPTTQEPTTQAPMTQEPTTDESESGYLNDDSYIYNDTATFLNVGANNLTLTPGKMNYFFFGPSNEGKFTLSLNNQTIKIGTAGSTFNVTSTLNITNVANNVLTLSVKASYISAGGSPQVIGLEVPAGVTSCTLTVTRIGSAEQTIEDLPWDVYEAKKTPVKFTYSESSTLTYVNLASNSKAILGSDGYYHLNTADGPILYVNLGPNAPYISYQTLLGCGPVRKYFYDGNGTFLHRM